MKKAFGRVVFSLIVGTSYVATTGATTPLFATDLSSVLSENGDTGIVLVDTSQICSDCRELSFDLLEHPSLVADRISAEVHADGTLVWHGHVRGHAPCNQVQLILRGSELLGKFHVDDRTYVLRPDGRGRHEFREEI